MSQTLRTVATTLAPGSEFVFQYVAPAATLASDEAALVDALVKRASTTAEPWISFYEPVEMDQHLLGAGFSEAEHFGPADATERYLQDRNDGLAMPAYFRMVKARRH